MFIKREDLVDMLEVIDCDNGYVDLDHLVECCNNLPSSGMSVWCMKCENNGECMTIDKPNCFQPRVADTPQTERRYKEADVVRVVEIVKRGYGLTKTAEEIVADMQTETQTETQNSNLTFEQTDCEITECDYHKYCKERGQTDCGWK